MLGLGLGTSKGGFVDALAEVTNTKSILFDGGDEFINCGDIELNGLSGLTVSAWFKANSTGASSRIVSKDQVGTAGCFILWIDQNSDLIFQAHNGTGYKVANYTSFSEDTNWHHVAGVFSATAIKLYLDGAEVASATYSSTTLNDSENEEVVIGADSDVASTDHHFNGNIDEVAIWSSALSATEITQIYNSNRGTLDLSTDTGDYSSSANLKAWWRMGDEASTRVLDTDANNLVIPDMRKTFFTSKSIDFDGTDDYVKVGSQSFTDDSDFSISLWFKSSDTTKQTPLLTSPVDSTGNWSLKMKTSGKVTFSFSDGSNSINSQDNGSTCSDGQWHHVVMTVDRSNGCTHNRYIDGGSPTARGSTAVTGDLDTGNFYYIGAVNGSGNQDNFANAQICDVAIFNTVLDANTVTSIYNSGEPNNLTLPASYTAGSGVDKTANLQAYYRLGNTTLFGDNSEANVILDANATLGTELLPALSDSNYTGGSDLTLTMDGNELNVARDGSSDIDVVLASPITLETNTKYLFEIEIGAGSSSSGALINVRGDESVLGNTTYFNEYIGRLVKSAVAFTSDSSATGFFFQIVANVNSQNFNIVNVSLKKILTATNTASMVNMSNFDIVDHAPNRNSGDMINFDATADIETDTP